MVAKATADAPDPARSAAALWKLLANEGSGAPPAVMEALSFLPYSAAALGGGQVVPGVDKQWPSPEMACSGLLKVEEGHGGVSTFLNSSGVELSGQQVLGFLGVLSLEVASWLFQQLAGSQALFPGQHISQGRWLEA